MRRFFGFVLAAALALPSLGFAADYKIDGAHSSATFGVRHMMISNVKGRFTDISGTIHLDDQDVTKSSVIAVLKAASVSTDNETRDKHLRSADFFDVEKYPEIRFESTRVEKRGDGYVAFGKLTMKDVSREIELPFTLAQAEIRGRKRLGIEATTQLNRYDYHVSYDPTGATVGKDVKIDLNLEAAADSPAPAGAAAGSKK